MLVCAVMSCLFFVALLSPVGKGLTSCLSCECLAFCHFRQCVLVHIRIKAEVGIMKRISPAVKYFTDRFKAVLLLWIFYVFSVLCLLCARLFICALWSPAGKGLTSWLSFVVSNCEFVTFPCGILGQVWYLIVSIPDLCTLSYYTKSNLRG